MTRTILSLTFAPLLLVACATAPKPLPSVDPVKDPTVIGAIDEGRRQAEIEADSVAKSARRAGRIAGVLAAVFTGPDHQDLFESIARYHIAKDIVQGTVTAAAASHGMREGAKRGFVLDQQFAELHNIEGIDVFRPQPSLIVARLGAAPSQRMLSSVALVLMNREERAIDIEAPGDAAQSIRTSLIDLGVPASSLSAYQNEGFDGVVLRITYKD